MKTVSLSGSPRGNVGKKDAKGLRDEGRVPCVAYGGDEQIHFHVSEIELKKLVYTPDVYQIDLAIGDKNLKCIVQEMQFHPVTDRIMHADFLQLFEDKEVNINLPVRLEGNPIGVLNGGRLAQNFRRLKVRGLPGDMPESIDINVEKLRIGGAIRISELDEAGLKFLDPHSAVVVAVKMARAAVLDDEEEDELEEGAEGAPAEGGDAAPAEGGGDEPAEEASE